MARRKAMKTKTRKVYVKSKSKRRSAPKFNLMAQVLSAGIYGALRGRASQMLSPITSRVPMGQYADEAVMGTLSYFMAKGKLGAQFKKVGMAGLHIESAMVGSQLAQGSFESNTNSNNNLVIL